MLNTFPTPVALSLFHSCSLYFCLSLSLSLSLLLYLSLFLSVSLSLYLSRGLRRARGRAAEQIERRQTTSKLIRRQAEIFRIDDFYRVHCGLIWRRLCYQFDVFD